MNKQKWLLAAYFVLILGCLSSCEMKNTQKTYTLFVGTYTDGDSEGIYRYTFNTVTGKLTDKALAATGNNPSFLKIAPNKEYVYAVNETDTYEDGSGAVTAYKIDDGTLVAFDTVSSFGAHPCHIGISEDGTMVAVSNYTGGNISVFKVDSEGRLVDPQLLDHTLLDSTKVSHAHSALFSQDKLFVADLGLDVVNAYSLSNGKVEIKKPQVLKMPEKTGPRHFVFGNEDTFMYVINELNSTISVFQKGADSYALVETKSTLASYFKGDSYCADIRLSSDGKYLYGSNRGENTIVIFNVDNSTGKLSLVGRESVRGDWPRNFNLDPSGNFLLVANQRSNNITVYKRDKENGTLAFAYELALPSPVCLEFLE